MRRHLHGGHCKPKQKLWTRLDPADERARDTPRGRVAGCESRFRQVNVTRKQAELALGGDIEFPGDAAEPEVQRTGPHPVHVNGFPWKASCKWRMSPLLGLGKAIEERDRVGLEASDSSSPPRDRHRSGIDPLKAKKAKRKEAKEEAENTVAALWEKSRRSKGRHLKSWHERVRQFRRDIAPLCARPITEVNRADLRAWLDTRATQAPVRANANYRTMRRFLKF